MSEQSPVLSPEKAGTIARVIHGAISGGLVLVFAVFVYLQRQLAIEFPAEGARVVRIAGYTLLAAAILGAQFLRGRLTSPRSGEDLSGWWTLNLPKAVVVWALAEGGGLGTIVLGWVIGDTTLLALGGAVALALLFVSRPSRLERTI
jgi:hypothetical protein